MSIANMEKHKLTINASKYIPVDNRLTQSRLARHHKHLRCHISKHAIQEQVEYFIFTTKLLVLQITTKVVGIDAAEVRLRPTYTVKRQETDFYILRNILTLSYSQCFVPPLTPTLKESLFDRKSLMMRERSFSRFLRGIIRSPEILNHPLVIDFLTIDHSKSQTGLRDFSQTLLTEEQALLKAAQTAKRTSTDLPFNLRITSIRERITNEREFAEQELINEKI